MLQMSKEELVSLGAEVTTREISQQPELWLETLTIFQQKKQMIEQFLEKVICQSDGKKVRVLFTGAGTSQYVGDSIFAYLRKFGDRKHFDFESIGTTELVSAPDYHLFSDEVLLLVSFARSGNSPESLAAVDLARTIVPNLYQLTITCAQDGELAKQSVDDEKNLLLLMPEKSNDAGFAMTGSFTCMMLMALLIFDQSYHLSEKESLVSVLSAMGRGVLDKVRQINDLLDGTFDRLVYLGSGSFSLLTREAQLKILELTAGQVATIFDSSMGFRHGPKSFITDKTLVFGFLNNNTYTRDYDLDILEEVAADNIAKSVIAIGQQGRENFSGQMINLGSEPLLRDAYLAFPSIMVAQVIALLSAIKVKNKPDTPSVSGTVNRVVKGVRIHPYGR